MYSGVENLHHVYIYAYGENLFDEHPETAALLAEEKRIIGNKYPGMVRSGRLDGNLTVHFTNVILRIQNVESDAQTPYLCLESVKKAGGFDDLDGVCAANISMFYYELQRRIRVPASEKPMEKALELIQEAIEDDPESPRNYYHLGMVYRSLARQTAGDAELEYEQKSLDAYRKAVARDPNNETDARRAVYGAETDELLDEEPPALDAAVELLERAVVDDPKNSCDLWYHRLFSVHKKRGDLAAARETYRRLIASDPIWHTEWHQIADTWIDVKLFDEERTFDWPNWCDALFEAIGKDPRHAPSYWGAWYEKAERLRGYGYFDIAIAILQYGAERSAGALDSYARAACARFFFLLGETFAMKGDWGSAVAQLEEAFARSDRLDIDDVRETLEWLAWAYMAEKRWEDALAVAETRLKLSPDEIWGDPSRHDAHAWMGEVALYQHRYADAAKEFKMAVRAEEEKLKKQAEGKPGKILSEWMAGYLLDLGIAYDRMERATQAAAVFKKAIPHVEHIVEEFVKMRERKAALFRGEGRAQMVLGWMLERQGVDAISDLHVLKEYERADWVFSRTRYVEDDFVEHGDIAAVQAAIKRVQSGIPYSYPNDDTFLRERLRWRIASKRTDWGNNDFEDEVPKIGRKGHRGHAW
ncbi:hypothetical protein QBC47DRAFT_457415 [Echria macrotheca]|uniref:Tetratricopeptide repeat protein n=1 Tax=Echria macrotheca TaxID=438768 RepID=A0AAJ0BIT7_9PEZI|nr:hypothetical protein QBC47DRAFT_457415 [Echria macrotheca]